MAEQIVPVIMYHSVGNPINEWRSQHLTCPYKTFEKQLNWLDKHNFETISLEKLYDYLTSGRDIPDKSIVLTFDDGYLDNWTFAYPLLKKYNFQATIFPAIDFIEKNNKIRRNLFDMWDDKQNIHDLPSKGHLSWKELKTMEKEGVMDVQSHTITHTWYPTGKKIIDFRHPKDDYIWMTWNNNKNQKPYLQTDNEELVEYGRPVYENGRAIGIKRYFPGRNLDDFVVDYVKGEGGKKFFEKRDWKKKLYKIVKEYKETHNLNDRYETDKEYEERVHFELKRSKEILEKRLNKKVDFLCWPGGAVTQKALDIADQIGYKNSTVGGDIPPKIRKKIKNKPNHITNRIDRMGASLYWDDRIFKYKNGLLFGLSIYQYKNKKLLGPISYYLNGGISRLYKFYSNYILK